MSAQIWERGNQTVQHPHSTASTHTVEQAPVAKTVQNQAVSDASRWSSHSRSPSLLAVVGTAVPPAAAPSLLVALMVCEGPVTGPRLHRSFQKPVNTCCMVAHCMMSRKGPRAQGRLDGCWIIPMCCQSVHTETSRQVLASSLTVQSKANAVQCRAVELLQQLFRAPAPSPFGPFLALCPTSLLLPSSNPSNPFPCVFLLLLLLLF